MCEKCKFESCGRCFLLLESNGFLCLDTYLYYLLYVCKSVQSAVCPFLMALKNKISLKNATSNEFIYYLRVTI